MKQLSVLLESCHSNLSVVRSNPEVFREELEPIGAELLSRLIRGKSLSNNESATESEVLGKRDTSLDSIVGRRYLCAIDESLKMLRGRGNTEEIVGLSAREPNREACSWASTVVYELMMEQYQKEFGAASLEEIERVGKFSFEMQFQIGAMFIEHLSRFHKELTKK